MLRQLVFAAVFLLLIACHVIHGSGLRIFCSPDNEHVYSLQATIEGLGGEAATRKGDKQTVYIKGTVITRCITKFKTAGRSLLKHRQKDAYHFSLYFENIVFSSKKEDKTNVTSDKVRFHTRITFNLSK